MGDNPGNSPYRKSEDYLLERKTQNDLKGLLKTMVVFVLAMWQQSSSTQLARPRRVANYADGTIFFWYGSVRGI